MLEVDEVGDEVGDEIGDEVEDDWEVFFDLDFLFFFPLCERLDICACVCPRKEFEGRSSENCEYPNSCLYFVLFLQFLSINQSPEQIISFRRVVFELVLRLFRSRQSIFSVRS